MAYRKYPKNRIRRNNPEGDNTKTYLYLALGAALLYGVFAGKPKTKSKPKIEGLGDATVDVMNEADALKIQQFVNTVSIFLRDKIPQINVDGKFGAISVNALNQLRGKLSPLAEGANQLKQPDLSLLKDPSVFYDPKPENGLAFRVYGKDETFLIRESLYDRILDDDMGISTTDMAWLRS